MSMWQDFPFLKERLLLGLMSGTSADGVDIALVRTMGSGIETQIFLEGFTTLPYSEKIRPRIKKAQAGGYSARDLLLLDVFLGELFAAGALRFLKKSEIELDQIHALGSHGQTILHHPQAVSMMGFPLRGSLQLGSGAVIAQRTGLPTVVDFRSRDMAAGGGGAPLIPVLDWLLYHHRSRPRIALNIGGIANITILPQEVELAQVEGLDTGPGNVLLDLAAHHYSQGKLSMDKDGQWASKGRVMTDFLAWLLTHPFLTKPLPRSAERNEFGPPFFKKVLERAGSASPADVMATLTRFTIDSISTAIMEFAFQERQFEELIVSGGGANNPVIMAGLKKCFPKMMVTHGDDYPIPAKAKEAVLCAWLAQECILGNPCGLPSVTGASEPVVLGAIYPPPPSVPSEQDEN